MARGEPKNSDERVADEMSASPEDVHGGDFFEDGAVPLGSGPLGNDEAPTLRKELEEARDRNLRTQAEFENFRKRSRRELDDERRYAELPLLRDLLPVLDNVARAVEAAEKTEDSTSLVEGFKLVAQQLHTVLKNHNCTPIPANGAPFDPNLHQAIAGMPTNEHPPGTVVRVVQEGYQLHDRVIRPAQVMVATEPVTEG